MNLHNETTTAAAADFYSSIRCRHIQHCLAIVILQKIKKHTGQLPVHGRPLPAKLHKAAVHSCSPSMMMLSYWPHLALHVRCQLLSYPL